MPASLKTYIKRDDINLKSTTVFDERPENPNAVPFAIRTRNKVTKSSKSGADGNYSTDDIKVISVKSKAFGPKGAYINTSDPRKRHIHGGGSGSDNPFADYQGWYPTYGCTRGQNKDVIELGKRILEFRKNYPEVKIPYERLGAGSADYYPAVED